MGVLSAGFSSPSWDSWPPGPDAGAAEQPVGQGGAVLSGLYGNGALPTPPLPRAAARVLLSPLLAIQRGGNRQEPGLSSPGGKALAFRAA